MTERRPVSGHTTATADWMLPRIDSVERAGASTGGLIPTPSAIRFENHGANRLGIGDSTPRLSWSMTEAAPGWTQAASQVVIVRTCSAGSASVESYDLHGSEQIFVPWPRSPVASRTHLRARVRVRGADGQWSAWGQWAETETGLIETVDWEAQLIGPGWAETATRTRRPGRVRKSFSLPEEIVQARLYITGIGVVQAEINGVRVGDEELTPGWTSYQERIRYATFDVTTLVRPGDNAIGVWLGDGWWRGQLGFGSHNADNYGDRIGVQCQLEVIDSRGSRTTVVSDSSWAAGFGPILASGLYDGERYDARLHDPRWSCADFDDSGWSKVCTLPSITERLVAPNGPPVRVVQELVPVGVRDCGGGRWILDFGQNHSGKLRVKLRASRGDVLTFRHSEVLIDGVPAYEPLRDARATDEVISDGSSDYWSPRFTIHGYRYAEVTGWHGPLGPGDVVSQVVHSDMSRTGWFECSDKNLNKLHQNAVWGMRSNFVDLPTDCPQRDERLGWTGDVQVFTPAATFLYDVAGFLDSWLRDVGVEQRPSGDIPLWVPYVDIPALSADFPAGPTAVWSDVAVLTPAILLERVADLELVRRHYGTARAHLENVADAAGESLICVPHAQLGDWLDPAAPAEDPAASLTEKELVATAYFAYSSEKLAAMARALGYLEDAARYGLLANQVKGAYADRFITDDGGLTSNTQTAYALTSAFGLWPDVEHAQRGGDRLVYLVRAAGWTVGTGFAGTPVLAEALTITGNLDEAYRLVQNDQAPSWLYMVASDATTIWERWDSLRPDGSLNTASMTSFNHFALGSIVDWMHRTIAGIAPAADGYRRIRFAPQPGGTVTSASARHRTPYGDAAISWARSGSRLEVRVEVPVGTEAEVCLPSGTAHVVGHGRYTFIDE